MTNVNEIIKSIHNTVGLIESKVKILEKEDEIETLEFAMSELHSIEEILKKQFNGH